MAEETTGTDLEPAPPTEVLSPLTGELIPVGDLDTIAKTILEIRDLEGKLARAKRELSDVFVRKSLVDGEKTFHLESAKVEVKKNAKSKSYDAEQIETQLREAGMPEKRIREIVVETTTYSVRAVEAKKAAAANPTYATIIDDNTTEHETTQYVSISEARGASRVTGSDSKAAYGPT